MNYERFIGIDPGKKGGIASFDTTGNGPACQTLKMPASELDTYLLFRSVGVHQPIAVLEAVHAFPGQGVSSVFTFGQGYGFLRGCLIACGIPFLEIPPRTWQKGLGIKAKPSKWTRREWKVYLFHYAQQLHPGVGVSLDTADALLIATYCLKTQG